MRPTTWIAVGALSGALTVALGAFGAHALADTTSPEDLAIWQTAVHYQGLHALALIGFGLYRRTLGGRGLAGWCFLVGGAVFSGTLYAMVLGAPRWFGAITPLGGSLLIAGWLVWAWGAWRQR